MSSSVICFLSHNGFLFDLFLKGDVYTRFLGLLQWLILDSVSEYLFWPAEQGLCMLSEHLGKENMLCDFLFV